MAANPPRLIGRKEASAYLGISESTFSGWVASHKMPAAVPGTRKWDKKAIDARLDEISGLEPVVKPKPSPHDEYEAWEAQQRERNRHAPRFNLGSRMDKILRFLIDHPDCNTTPNIPQAADRTMEQFKELGLVQSKGRDERGDRIWLVTEEGRSQIIQTDIYRNWKFKR